MVNTVGYIRISAFRMHVFHFLYTLGFLSALVNGLVLARLLQLHWWVIATLCAVAIVTFFSLVKFVRQWSGRENIVYYHHEIGILLASLIVLLVIRQPVATYLDITIIGIGIFNIFGRWGCFFVGCCHGKPCRVGVKYHHAHVEQGFPFYYENVRLFPVQLVESLGASILVAVCIGSVLRGNYVPGEIVVMYSVLYGCGRFILELFRGDPEREYWRGLSEAQWTSIIIVLITTSLGYAGYLPLYSWHLWVSAAMVALAAVLLILHRTNISISYFNPHHVNELADALSSMKRRNLNLFDPESLELSVCTTSAGITVSYSCDAHDTGNSYIYGISGGRPLNRKLAGRFGKLFGVLNRHAAAPEILYDGKGTYYLIFDEKNQ